MINVQSLSPTTFRVTVSGTTETTHMVTVAPEYAAKLTKGDHSVGHLVKASFEFLLEREPNTSILREFDLPLIGRYFPEYEREVGSLL